MRRMKQNATLVMLIIMMDFVAKSDSKGTAWIPKEGQNLHQTRYVKSCSACKNSAAVSFNSSLNSLLVVLSFSIALAQKKTLGIIY